MSALRKAGAVVACCAAILVRQTNVSWVLFVFGTTCLADLIQQSSSGSSPSPSSTSSSFLAEPGGSWARSSGTPQGCCGYGFLLAPVAVFAYLSWP